MTLQAIQPLRFRKSVLKVTVTNLKGDPIKLKILITRVVFNSCADLIQCALYDSIGFENIEGYIHQLMEELFMDLSHNR